MGKREGAILVLIGGFLLLLNLGIITRHYTVLFVGLVLLTFYFFDKNSAMIIPAFIVSSMGLYNVLGVHYNIPRPFLLIFLGLAFLGIYLIEKKDNYWAIFPAAALSLTGFYQVIRNSTLFEDISHVFGPILIILIGFVVLIKSK